MLMVMNHSYEDFWAALAPAYPVSKGSMRLPIATELQTIPELNMPTVLKELQQLLQGLLDDQGVLDGARARAIAAGETQFVSLIDGSYNGVVRFDCVVDGFGEVKILELNADYPDGLLLHDATYGVLSGESCTLHTEAYQRYFSAADTVHISHPAEAGFLDAYYVEKEALEAAGHTVTIGAELTSEPTVWHRRCLEVGKISPADIAHWGAQHAQHLNSFALRTLGYKELLATLNHRFIPKTLSMDTDEVFREVGQDPARWVLKPSNGYEGNGLYFGSEYAEDEWRALIDSLPAGYIAQEYVQLPRQTVDIYTDGKIVSEELYYDFCPHFFIRDGKVAETGHILMRFSRLPVVNVSQGGAIGYHQLINIVGSLR